ncbi:small, acid-soluble spore protein, alpha/beta type [Paenibacillus thermoaerophilus]|uniref:Small, acid-soluble spore protein, alpha/beta type n=1 Tax=Paenibacillus thermoaerophilus TaxID=1215385 RepID=A0ABW2UZ20_9BACL|nr:alpha/beta-type small acid-soluble spore protein [Paenibacillus thermoaerophilus]TMV15975.1 alpha/beta-type small acid-soluble spore protein [Paenibacillus thermoaerophilus]
MARNNSSNTLVVPQASNALDQLKYEVAQELGIAIPQDGYMGNVATRDTGAIGGNITRRLVQIAEQQLAGQAGQAK